MRFAALAVFLTTATAAAECPEGKAPFPPLYSDRSLFETALADSADLTAAPDPVYGVTVPHHLAAPDLIATGLRRAAGRTPTRIIVLFPDHFYRLSGAFGTSARGFDTLLGPVPGDPAAARLIASGLASDTCIFDREHGLRAVLPFLARLFPGVPVLPLAIAIGSERGDWDQAAVALAPLIGPETLLVQATDFSHYLPHHLARQRDQQMLNLIAAADLDQIARLTQPGHIDSLGALYLMTRLMAEKVGAAPVVIANRNLQEGQAQFIAETTSYVVALYQKPGADPGPAPAGQPVYMLGGDFFVGRNLTGLLSDDLIADRVATAAHRATRGLPLIANLEGVVLPEVPGNLEHLTLGMPAGLAVDMAQRLNVVGFGLANNHANDIGASGRAETQAALTAAGIAFAGPGEALTLPGLRLVALSDLDSTALPRVDRLDEALLDRLISDDPTEPVLAFVHWGREWNRAPSDRERDLALAMSRRGVSAIVGAHPHVASAGAEALNGGDTVVFHSLGNLLFDQMPPKASGALVELRSFAQGTVFLREIPLPPLFALARRP
ncbi:AmmeMemoRadiSam system protein B [Pseudooceanicola sp.]|uniref:AmmeMemoRadiSam system protein B n=1 Tax=Pseudooceanicola sp. TaxID=1914328 RepID=UPI00261ABFB8|nr:AmmeMemoRadiSam system protein B [Pseudooceanicola sp.]MDF1856177.1 AmmeMemoRadiSam system protein B [Pseudooceanicola sp.]